MKTKRFCLDQICSLYKKWDNLRRTEHTESEKSISSFLSELEKTCNLVGKNAIHEIKTDNEFWQIMAKSASQWLENHERFKKIESFVRNILVVNDTAERGIKLISDYANCLTKNASERQEILQLVEYHRSKISDDKESTIKRSYNRDFLM